MGANSEGALASTRASCSRFSRNRLIRPAASPQDRSVERNSSGDTSGSPARCACNRKVLIGLPSSWEMSAVKVA